MYPHQETIAEEKIDISKLPAKLQTKINKFNELEKKKFRTEEEEEEIAEKDEAIFNDIQDWLDEQVEDEPEGEPKNTPKATKKEEKEEEPENKEREVVETELATAPTATPKKKVEPTPATPPKEKVFNPVLGFAE